MIANKSPILSLFDHENLSGVAYKDKIRRRRIIGHLSESNESTINEISDLLNISVPKATELLAELEEEGYVCESGKRSEGPGRKASMYKLGGESCYFLGLEIKKYRINIGLLGFDKQLVHVKRDITFLYHESTESLEKIVVELEKFLAEIDVPKSKILGMGVSISGRVNVKTGRILTIYHFGDSPVKETLEKAIGIPVYLDNDSRALAYGEFNFGRRKNEQEVCILNMDYGMALGIFVHGKPLFGISGYAGELGHIPLFNNEKICFCGKRGCLETEASGRALIENIVEQMNNGANSILAPILKNKGFLELEDVIEAINKGDNLAFEALRGIAEHLGRGLAVTINLLNPELIILSGLLSKVGELLLLPVKTSLLQHSLTLVNSDTGVIVSQIGEDAGLLGCCLLVRDKMLALVS